MGNQIDEQSASDPIQEPPVSKPPKNGPERRLVGLALVVLLVTIGAMTAFLLWSSDDEGEQAAAAENPPLQTTPAPTDDSDSDPARAADDNTVFDVVSNGDAPFAIREPLIAEVAGVPLTDAAISPSGRLLAHHRGSEICVLDPTVGTQTPSEGCVEFGDSIAADSLVWSPDETRVAFHHDVFGLGEDPDIVVLDVDTGTVEVLTDDGVDEDGDVDLAPFFDDDAALRFFRFQGGDEISSRLMEIGGAVDRDLRVPGIATGAGWDSVTQQVAVVVFGSDRRTILTTIDPERGTVTVFDTADGLPPFDDFIDVAGGRVVADLRPTPDGGVGAGVADLTVPGVLHLAPSGPSGSDRAVSGIGLSPDGSQLIMIIEHRTDPAGHQLVVAALLDDGSIGPLVELAAGGEFAPTNDITVRPHGLGQTGRVLWANDRIVFSLGPDQIVTLPISERAS